MAPQEAARLSASEGARNVGYVVALEGGGYRYVRDYDVLRLRYSKRAADGREVRGKIDLRAPVQVDTVGQELRFRDSRHSLVMKRSDVEGIVLRRKAWDRPLIVLGVVVAAGVAAGGATAYAFSRRKEGPSDSDMSPIGVIMAGAAAGGLSVAFTLPLTSEFAD